MSEGRRELRVKVCLRCKTYIRIFPNNPASQIIERKFDANHSCHSIVLVSKDELDDNYKREDIKSE